MILEWHFNWGFEYSSLERASPALGSNRHDVRCSTVFLKLTRTRTLYVKFARNTTSTGSFSNCTSLSFVVDSWFSTFALRIFALFLTCWLTCSFELFRIWLIINDRLWEVLFHIPRALSSPHFPRLSSTNRFVLGWSHLGRYWSGKRMTLVLGGHTECRRTFSLPLKICLCTALNCFTFSVESLSFGNDGLWR